MSFRMVHRPLFAPHFICILFSRYRISGSSLLAAMDQSSQAPYTDVLSIQSGDMDDKEQNDGYHAQVNEETLSRVDDRSGRVHQTVDVAEIIRRWTHALQRIHKQSLQLVCCFFLFLLSQLSQLVLILGHRY